MSSKKPIVTYEFGSLYIEGQAHREGDTPLGEVAFNNLWNFILSNKADGDADVVMSVHTRGGKKYIKTGRFVGTIQTRDGQVIEVLPKIYRASGQQEKGQKVCRQVFLNMLRHFTDARAKSFQNASLGTKKGFPILEVYISNYIDAVEQLVLGGLKKNYTFVEENQKFLKGKLNVEKQITKNVANKATFSIQYNKYIEDIPQNRIVVSTLKKLFSVSHSNTNKAHISALLTILADIPSSNNIEADLRMAIANNRLFASYDMLMKWSSQFLLNRGFTTFSGSCVNQSLLFQAERLFEDFIAYLFKKYAPTYKYTAESQHNKYFLVDKHNEKGLFRLRPDIVVEKNFNNEDHECIIIDTKWKSIDSTKPDSNYLIDIKDMYQLYAYGQKYKQGQTRELGYDTTPKLVLIYPYSEKFTEKLPEFIYEDVKEKFGLKLMVVPFDLLDIKSYEKQVHNIIRSLNVKPNIQPVYNIKYFTEENALPLVAEPITTYQTKKTILVGCYKNKEHLDWIKENQLYNIRLGNNRVGGVTSLSTIISATRLVLYNISNPDEYEIYSLDASQHIIADYKSMNKTNYPGLEPGREYVLYVLKSKIDNRALPEIVPLIDTISSQEKKGAPFFIYEYMV